MIHDVKSWPKFFNDLRLGSKRHELRNNDRDYQAGDTLHLREYDSETSSYTGRHLDMSITYVTSAENPCALSGDGLNKGYCILSVALRFLPID